MFQEIVWDFDGTLFDTYPVTARVLQAALADRGIHEEVDEIQANLQVSYGHAFALYQEKHGIDKAFWEQNRAHSRRIEFDQCAPFDGVPALCRAIVAAGKRNYLYTHRGASSIAMLKAHGLYTYFSDCITSEHGFERKPSPQALTHLIRHHQLERGRLLMIGDRELDVLAAKNAGAQGCLISDQPAAHTCADYRLRDMSGLYAILDIEPGKE